MATNSSLFRSSGIPATYSTAPSGSPVAYQPTYQVTYPAPAAPAPQPNVWSVNAGPNGLGGTTSIQGVGYAPAPTVTSGYVPRSRAVQSIMGIAKNPAQGSRIGQLYGDYDAGKTGQQQSLTDFARSYSMTDPTAKGYLDSETGALTGIYDGTQLGDLNRITDAGTQASNMAALRAMGKAKAQSSLFRLGQGGNSSYADAQLADQYAGIATDAAARNAAARMDNYRYNQAAKMASLGRRSGLLTDYLGRQLVPGQANSQVFSNNLEDLAALGNLDAANTDYLPPQIRYDGQPDPRSFYAR